MLSTLILALALAQSPDPCYGWSEMCVTTAFFLARTPGVCPVGPTGQEYMLGLEQDGTPICAPLVDAPVPVLPDPDVINPSGGQALVARVEELAREVADLRAEVEALRAALVARVTTVNGGGGAVSRR